MNPNESTNLTSGQVSHIWRKWSLYNIQFTPLFYNISLQISHEFSLSLYLSLYRMHATPNPAHRRIAPGQKLKIDIPWWKLSTSKIEGAISLQNIYNPFPYNFAREISSHSYTEFLYYGVCFGKLLWKRLLFYRSYWANPDYTILIRHERAHTCIHVMHIYVYDIYIYYIYMFICTYIAFTFALTFTACTYCMYIYIYILVCIYIYCIYIYI